jgi:hypothetical protein
VKGSIPLSAALLIAAAGLATGASTPTAETLKQVLTKKLLALKPASAAERNVLFQVVQVGRPRGESYPFRVTALVRDYDPGYPSERDRRSGTRYQSRYSLIIRIFSGGVSSGRQPVPIRQLGRPAAMARMRSTSP